MKIQLKNIIEQKTNQKIYTFFSPARINLIGEHIDYVGGLVLPAAINLGIWACVAKSSKMHINSLNFQNGSQKGWQTIENSKKEYRYDQKQGYLNFLMGVINELKDKIKEDQKFTMVLNSSIPIAAGLSSSAAFGMLLIETFDNLYNLNLTALSKAQIFKKVENKFIKLNSGIMDPFAIAFGKKNYFIELNTATLKYKYVQAMQKDYKFLLFSTNKSRELSSSAYNKRVEELKEVSQILEIPFNKLAQTKDLNVLEKIPVTLLQKRMKHVITESMRVNKVVSELKTISGNKLGKIISASHKSLKKDYEVSCDELDFIHDKLSENKKVYGSRMIGAGFGGCLLAIVKKDFEINDISFVEDYYKNFGIKFDVFDFQIEDGVKRVYD